MNDLEQLLKHFRKGVSTTSSAFFAWKGINNIASSDRDVYRAMNEDALSWGIITHSLQNTFFKEVALEALSWASLMTRVKSLR